METVKTAALVIGSTDSGEADKQITLLTMDYGKIICVLKGVRKPNAKLKAFGQTLCFGNYEIVKGRAMPIIVGCEVVETFFDLAADYSKFNLASQILRLVAKSAEFEQPCPELAILTLKCLKYLIAHEASEVLLVKFLLQLHKSLGSAQSFENECAQCAVAPRLKKFDYYRGGIVCAKCASPFALDIDGYTQTMLRLIDSCDFENLGAIVAEQSLKRAIYLLTVDNYI